MSDRSARYLHTMKLPDFLKTQNDLEEMLADFKKGRVLHEE